jgi:flagellar motor switch protein FliM
MSEMELAETVIETNVTTVAPGLRKAVEQPGVQNIEAHPAWPVLSGLVMPVSAEVGLAAFKVRDLLALKSGQVIGTGWKETEDVVVRSGDVHLAWSEFEVEEQRLLIRLTRLA